MNKYEIMFIVKPTLDDKTIKEIAKSFEKVLTDNNAKLLESKDMGQRELAYEIKKNKSGYYFLMIINALDDKAIKEFDRLALINENIIRHLIIKAEK